MGVVGGMVFLEHPVHDDAEPPEEQEGLAEGFDEGFGC